MSIEERMRDAFADIDLALADASTVVSALNDIARAYGLAPEVLRARAEREFGSLSVRRRLLIFKRRSRKDVKEFLDSNRINSNWQNLYFIELKFERFLSEKYKKKVSTLLNKLDKTCVDCHKVFKD